jgi:hypothetical protein
MSDPEDILSYLDIESFSQNRAEEIRTEIIRFIRMHWIDNEEESAKETNNNPNFMQEKDMKYNLYPFYINWKLIEANEYNYFDVFVHFGYLGASIYSSLRDIYPKITNKNIIFVFSTFCYDFLVSENEDQEKDDKDLIIFIQKSPEINQIYNLIKKKIIMFKEIPIFLIILKIYEIYYLYKDERIKIIDLLKYQYLLISYMTDDEFNEIFQEHFKGKVSSIFRKLVNLIGNQLELPNTRKKYINHIKYIYQTINKNIQEEEDREDGDEELEDEK